MLVEIAVACHLFQRRLVWMLSSILQQVGDKPDIVVSISYVPNNGIPTTEDCIRFFREKGLNIIDVVMEPGQESIRVLARNIRAKETQADWMIWADADMVYHKEFFADLKNKVSQEPVLSCTQVMGADRHSLNIPFCRNSLRIVFGAPIQSLSHCRCSDLGSRRDLVLSRLANS